MVVWLRLNKSNIAIVIQCRDGSTRYKEKSVRPFYKGKSILEIIMAKFKHLPYKIIITTTPHSYITIQQVKRAGVDVMVGEEGDVLSRFCDVVRTYELDGVFRVCADNPFIQLPLMFPVVAWAGDMDYVAFYNAMQRKEGFWIEYVSTFALLDADKFIDHEGLFKREHVTEYIYNHIYTYKVKWLEIPELLKKHPNIHLTVDSKNDFEIAQMVYKDVGEKHWYYIIDWFYGD